VRNPFFHFRSFGPPILLSGLISTFGSITASGQNRLNELGTALEAGELNWVASPADAWRAVSSSSAKVNRDLVACFEAEAFGPDDDDFRSAGCGRLSPDRRRSPSGGR
jgi:hypothetical protein